MVESGEKWGKVAKSDEKWRKVVISRESGEKWWNVVKVVKSGE